jgi:hypothetical protein
MDIALQFATTKAPRQKVRELRNRQSRSPQQTTHHNIISSDAKNTNIRSRIPTKIENRRQKEFPRERRRERERRQRDKNLNARQRVCQPVLVEIQSGPLEKIKPEAAATTGASSEPPGKAGREHKNAATNVTKQRDQTLMQHQTKLGIGILGVVLYICCDEAPRACARV